MSTKILTSRFEKGLVYATQLHQNQVRKGSDVPYISHLLSVAALVLEDGGDEDQAIAALLHDAIEDQGGDKIRQEIKTLFEEKVTNIVNGCTDSEILPKPPWHERKQQYIQKMRFASPKVRRVSLADKLHNLRSIFADYHRSETCSTRFFINLAKHNALHVDAILLLILKKTLTTKVPSFYNI